MLTSPSCRCCGCKVVKDASFPGFSCAGSFVGSSGNTIWTTIAAPAFRFHNDNTAAGKPWKASASAIVMPSGMFGLATLRLAVGTDCDNHVYSERSNTQLRLGKVVAGVDTPLTFSPHAPGPSVPFSSPTTLALPALCWDGTTLTGGGMATRDVSISDARIGYGVTSLSNVTSVGFTNVALDLSYSHQRPLCEACAEHCCKGPVPAALELEISGLLSELVGSPCLTDCAAMNGTWILTASSDASCSWNLTATDVTEYTCTFLPFPPVTTPSFLQFVATVARTGGGTRVITVTIFTSDGGLTLRRLAWLYAETESPCIDFTSWIDLDVLEASSACSMAGSPVFRIRKAA